MNKGQSKVDRNHPLAITCIDGDRVVELDWNASTRGTATMDVIRDYIEFTMSLYGNKYENYDLVGSWTNGDVTTFRFQDNHDSSMTRCK